MTSPIHIVGCAGSLRKDSYNRAALRLAQQIVLEYESVAFEIIDLGNLPLFNQAQHLLLAVAFPAFAF